jgi:hypothetical protein
VSKLRTVINQDVIFFCPGCENTHSVNVIRDTRPRWTFNGSAEKPTFSPSILVTTRWSQNDKDMKDEICHSFIKDGQIQFLDDCTHKLKGQTVEIPEWPYKFGEYGGVVD